MALGRSLMRPLAACGEFSIKSAGRTDAPIGHYGRGDGLLPAGLRGPERCARMGA